MASAGVAQNVVSLPQDNNKSFHQKPPHKQAKTDLYILGIFNLKLIIVKL